MKLRYHGHSCWEIEGEHGGKRSRLLIDPFLTGNGLADVEADFFEDLDALLITHGHGDHIGDGVEIAARTGALVVANFEIANYFSDKGCQSHPMHIGGGREFPFGHVRLTLAHHASSGPEGEYLGNPAGLVVRMGDQRIYHAGDTGLFLDMQLIGEHYGPLNVALLPIGDNFTMGIEDAVKAAGFLDAGMTIPMHYNTFPVIEQNPDDFVKRVESLGLRAVVVKPGESYPVG